jgi:asparagine synthase (glutamine-hydrolysing)
LAALFAALTKPLGLKGIFYKIVGESVRSIDGPTEYSLFPSNVSAKLGPKDPQKVSEKLKTQISNLKSESQMSNFLGVAIIDANDIGRNVLGNSIGLSNKLIEKIMDDNPMGQSDEQTPILIVQYK